MLDQGDADGLDQDGERVLGVDAASVLVSIDGSSGLTLPPLVKQVLKANALVFLKKQEYRVPDWNLAFHFFFVKIAKI